jgi:hypothetical protein
LNNNWFLPDEASVTRSRIKKLMNDLLEKREPAASETCGPSGKGEDGEKVLLTPRDEGNHNSSTSPSDEGQPETFKASDTHSPSRPEGMDLVAGEKIFKSNFVFKETKIRNGNKIKK